MNDADDVLRCALQVSYKELFKAAEEGRLRFTAKGRRARMNPARLLVLGCNLLKLQTSLTVVMGSMGKLGLQARSKWLSVD